MIYLVFMPKILKIFRNGLSFILTIALVSGMIQQGLVKVSDFSAIYVYNGALTCLTNIIKENKDETWTIVSANDELQMGLDHGWHY